jgi:hypothetical protein
LTPEIINENIQNVLQPVDFFFNNINLKNYGVIVEHLEGVFNRPELKEPLTVDWKDYHGEVVDLIKPVLSVREIEMKCVIKASTQDDMISKWIQFRSVFEQPGTTRLQIDAGTTPLLFDVYHRERLEVTNKWRNTGPYFLRFPLKFREPEPVKRVLKVTGNSVTLTISTAKMVSISWGDGDKEYNVYGTDVVRTHTYDGSGPWYVLINGVIEDITDFDTNAAIMFDRI